MGKALETDRLQSRGELWHGSAAQSENEAQFLVGAESVRTRARLANSRYSAKEQRIRD
jgi:hypothetical protein